MASGKASGSDADIDIADYSSDTNWSSDEEDSTKGKISMGNATSTVSWRLSDHFPIRSHESWDEINERLLRNAPYKAVIISKLKKGTLTNKLKEQRLKRFIPADILVGSNWSGVHGKRRLEGDPLIRAAYQSWKSPQFNRDDMKTLITAILTRANQARTMRRRRMKEAGGSSTLRNDESIGYSMSPTSLNKKKDTVSNGDVELPPLIFEEEVQNVTMVEEERIEVMDLGAKLDALFGIVNQLNNNVVTLKAEFEAFRNVEEVRFKSQAKALSVLHSTPLMKAKDIKDPVIPKDDFSVNFPITNMGDFYVLEKKVVEDTLFTDRLGKYLTEVADQSIPKLFEDDVLENFSLRGKCGRTKLIRSPLFSFIANCWADKWKKPLEMVVGHIGRDLYKQRRRNAQMRRRAEAKEESEQGPPIKQGVQIFLPTDGSLWEDDSD